VGLAKQRAVTQTLLLLIRVLGLVAILSYYHEHLELDANRRRAYYFITLNVHLPSSGLAKRSASKRKRTAAKKADVASRA